MTKRTSTVSTRGSKEKTATYWTSTTHSSARTHGRVDLSINKWLSIKVLQYSVYCECAHYSMCLCWLQINILLLSSVQYAFEAVVLMRASHQACSQGKSYFLAVEQRTAQSETFLKFYFSSLLCFRHSLLSILRGSVHLSGCSFHVWEEPHHTLTHTHLSNLSKRI